MYTLVYIYIYNSIPIYIYIYILVYIHILAYNYIICLCLHLHLQDDPLEALKNQPPQGMRSHEGPKCFHLHLTRQRALKVQLQCLPMHLPRLRNLEG